MLRWLSLALCLLALPAFAQTNIIGGGMVGDVKVASSGYTGPGDLGVGTAYAWWGLRAYNAAYATAGSPAIVLCTPADATCDTIDVASNGSLAPGLITTLGCNNTTTICLIKEWFDQSGSSNCSGACNVSQTTYTQQAELFVPGAGNGCPQTTDYCAVFAPNDYYDSANVASTQAQPISLYAVDIRTGAFTSITHMLYQDGLDFGWNGSANTGRLYANGSAAATATISDSSWHVEAGLASGTSTYLEIDGVAGSTANSGTMGITSSNPFIISSNEVSGYLTGKFVEGGYWATSWSSGNFTSICHNAYAYWGTSTSC